VQVGDFIPGLHFSVTTPMWIYMASTPFTATVTALDQYNHVATGYHGTVRFSSSDHAAGAVLPADYTFTPGDGGVHAFSGVTLVTRATSANPASLTVTDPANGAGGPGSGGTLFVIDALAPISFTVTGFPSPATAGAAGTFTVTARDVYGNVSDWYQGTVHFTSTDPQAALPADYTFTYSPSAPSDQGVHTFTATLGTAELQAISVNAVASPSVAGSQTGISVTPAAASSFRVEGFPSSVTAGTAASLTVTALDAYGNVATGYAGTVHFASTDPLAALPADYTFTAADAGTRVFTATLFQAGSRSLTVSDVAAPALSGSRGGILVTPAAARQLRITTPTDAEVGVAFSVTVTVLDAYGNIVPGYTGGVHFQSSGHAAARHPETMKMGSAPRTLVCGSCPGRRPVVAWCFEPAEQCGLGIATNPKLSPPRRRGARRVDCSPDRCPPGQGRTGGLTWTFSTAVAPDSTSTRRPWSPACAASTRRGHPVRRSARSAP
jgi:hypothetical protein